MPVIFNPFLVQLFSHRRFSQTGLIQEFILCVHFCPLEWSKRLRDKERGTGHYLYLSCPLFFGDCLKEKGGDLIGKLGYAPDILFRFRRKTQHKVQLYPGPASFKGHSGAFQYNLFRQSFVNYITESLTACFRSKSKTALLHILYLAHDIQ